MTDYSELLKRLWESRSTWEDGKSIPSDLERDVGDAIEALRAEVERLRKQLSIAEISVEGMSEIKAIADGDTTNTIQDVVDGVLSRIAALCDTK